MRATYRRLALFARVITHVWHQYDRYLQEKVKILATYLQLQSLFTVVENYSSGPCGFLSTAVCATSSHPAPQSVAQRRQLHNVGSQRQPRPARSAS